MNHLIRIAAATILLSMFATAAGAQSAVDVVVMELDELVDEGVMEGEIVDVNYDERSLTVRWESDNETAKLIVPEGADLVQVVPNRLETPLELTDFRLGDRVRVEGVEIEGAIHMRIVSM